MASQPTMPQQQSMQPQQQSSLPPNLSQSVNIQPQPNPSQMLVSPHPQQFDAQQMQQQPPQQHMQPQQLPPPQQPPPQQQQPQQQLGGAGTQPGSPDGQTDGGGITHEQLKQMLQHQLEYYFSR